MLKGYTVYMIKKRLGTPALTVVSVSVLYLPGNHFN